MKGILKCDNTGSACIMPSYLDGIFYYLGTAIGEHRHLWE